jgi:hypothetical protein
MGGFVPLGYDVKDRKLVINEAEAATVRMIFERFSRTGSATTLTRALRAEGVVGKRGKLIEKGYLYKLLKNPVYIGKALHADSDEVARAFRDDVARCSEMMPPGFRCLAGGRFLAFGCGLRQSLAALFARDRRRL